MWTTFNIRAMKVFTCVHERNYRAEEISHIILSQNPGKATIPQSKARDLLSAGDQK